MTTRVLGTGTRVRARFPGRLRELESPPSTTLVKEVTADGWAHYLNLSSSAITEANGDVSVDLEARVTGPYGRGMKGTTQVTEDDGTVHYLYLASDAVTVAEITNATAKIGDEIEVNLTARVSDNIPNRYVTTTEVIESPGNCVHYLFLRSGQLTANGENGYKARFTARITGEPGTGPAATTMVKELPGPFTHFVYLGSPSVTRRTAGETAKEPESAKEPEATPETVQPRETGTPVRPGVASFESAAVLNRLSALVDFRAVTYEITRTRTRERFGPPVPFGTRAAAEEYLDELDCNLERFTITPVTGNLSEEENEELALLDALNEAGRNTFGSAAWITRSVLLREDSEFTEDWARAEAAKRLGISRYLVDEWPLNQIDWSEAADNLLSAEYKSIVFGGRTYWGKSTG